MSYLQQLGCRPIFSVMGREGRRGRQKERKKQKKKQKSVTSEVVFVADATPCSSHMFTNNSNPKFSLASVTLSTLLRPAIKYTARASEHSRAVFDA